MRFVSYGFVLIADCLVGVGIASACLGGWLVVGCYCLFASSCWV